MRNSFRDLALVQKSPVIAMLAISNKNDAGEPGASPFAEAWLACIVLHDRRLGPPRGQHSNLQMSWVLDVHTEYHRVPIML